MRIKIDTLVNYFENDLPSVRHSSYGTDAKVYVKKNTVPTKLYSYYRFVLSLRHSPSGTGTWSPSVVSACKRAVYRNTLEQDIAIRQISVKDSNSYSWFVLCNKLLHKYDLPNIYIARKKFESELLFKQQV